MRCVLVDARGFMFIVCYLRILLLLRPYYYNIILCYLLDDYVLLD